jgi:hypothetical protein
MIGGVIRPVVALLAVVACLSGGVATPPASAAACTEPRFVTSDPDGLWADGRYLVHNNMWNADGYDVTETLSACSHRSWYVDATADDRTGGGAVKTYPNVHVDFHDWDSSAEPALASFRSITSRFAARAPRSGAYNAAYNVWLDGVPGEHEVMVWTNWRDQRPAGEVVARHRFGKHHWALWATDDNSYLAFVPDRRMRHGRLDLDRMLRWLVRRGRLPADTTLGQVCFGFEIVSTEGRQARFTVRDFSLRVTRRP